MSKKYINPKIAALSPEVKAALAAQGLKAVKIPKASVTGTRRKSHVSSWSRNPELLEPFKKIVLDAGQEFHKHPVFSSKASALDYIDDHDNLGWTVAEEDLNADGYPEVVVRDANKNMLYINGYDLVQNDVPLTRYYYENNPSIGLRKLHPKRSWITNEFYSTEQDPDYPNNPWRKVVNISDVGKDFKAKGWKMPKEPIKRLSVYSIWCKLFAPLYKEYFLNKDGICKDLLAHIPTPYTQDLGPACAEFIYKVIPQINAYKFFYDRMVIRPYYNTVKQSISQITDYEIFQSYMDTKDGKKEFYDFFRKYYLVNVPNRGLELDVNMITVKAITDNLTYSSNIAAIDGNNRAIDSGFFLMGAGDNMDLPVPDNYADPKNAFANTFLRCATEQDYASTFLMKLSQGDSEAVSLMKAFKANAKSSARLLNEATITIMDDPNAAAIIKAKMNGQDVNPTNPTPESSVDTTANPSPPPSPHGQNDDDDFLENADNNNVYGDIFIAPADISSLNPNLPTHKKKINECRDWMDTLLKFYEKLDSLTDKLSFVNNIIKANPTYGFSQLNLTTFMDEHVGGKPYNFATLKTILGSNTQQIQLTLKRPKTG
jgi:hypothetical protein